MSVFPEQGEKCFFYQGAGYLWSRRRLVDLQGCLGYGQLKVG